MSQPTEQIAPEGDSPASATQEQRAARAYERHEEARDTGFRMPGRPFNLIFWFLTGAAVVILAAVAIYAGV